MSQLEVISGSPDGPGILSGSTLDREYGYGLKMIPQEEFDGINQLVLAVLDQGRKLDRPKLTLITSDSSGMTADDRKYIAKHKPLGCTFAPAMGYTEFQTWIMPAFNDSQYFRAVLLHELVHGYVGIQYNHGPQWRRWYYRVLWHAINAGFLNLDRLQDSVQDLCRDLTCIYFQNDAKELALITEAIARSEAESDKVSDNLFRRLTSLRS